MRIKSVQIVLPILITFLALLINALIMLACGYQPIKAFVAMYQGALGGMREVTETFVKTCPLLLTGLAVAFAFRCGVWNIGAEGQYLIGTLVYHMDSHINYQPPTISLYPFDSCVWVRCWRILGDNRGAAQSLSRCSRGYQHNHAQFHRT